MTTQNNAAQPVLTDEEIQDIAELYDIYGEKPEFARAVEFALLHKLRAPVALRLPPRESENCGSSSAIAYAMAYNKALDDVAAINASAPVADERAALQRIVETAKDGANSGDRHARCVEIARATLASAPVAGEAVAWAVFAPNGNIRYWHHDKANVEAFAAKHGLPVTGIADAAPQASSVAGEAAGEIVLFGSDLKEVSWRDGKMPPAGTKLCVAPQAPAGWRWTLHPAGLHPDVYAAAAAHTSDEARNAALYAIPAKIVCRSTSGRWCTAWISRPTIRAAMSARSRSAHGCAGILRHPPPWPRNRELFEIL
ncbi:hypothetical protein CS345_14960 [Bordetella bronchiseptica]|uniref:hypothetical protein n=1 Tax=Bordetella bronchiseptica TaxID=518 RepID=UPI000FD70F6E|nr:hypothetical protein [Bordetella bronchiseptica]AZW22502.1 hypothetical protein CS345_14960 [Bordetella bronchiseptica]